MDTVGQSYNAAMLPMTWTGLSPQEEGIYSKMAKKNTVLDATANEGQQYCQAWLSVVPVSTCIQV